MFNVLEPGGSWSCVALAWMEEPCCPISLVRKVSKTGASSLG